MGTTTETADSADAAMEDGIEHFLHAPGMQPKIGRASADETLREVLI